MMDAGYSVVDQSGDDTPAASAPGPASRSSPVSATASPLSATTSPSSSTFLTLADQTFTPLSLSSSEWFLLGSAEGERSGSEARSSPGQVPTCLYGSKAEVESGTSGMATSTATTAAGPLQINGATLPKTLAARATTLEKGYELVSANKQDFENAISSNARDVSLSTAAATSSTGSALSPSRLNVAVDFGNGKARQISLIERQHSAALLDHHRQGPTVLQAATISDVNTSDTTANANLERDLNHDSGEPSQPSQPSQLSPLLNTPIVRPIPQIPLAPKTVSTISTIESLPLVVRTTSDAGLPICHPVPDLNTRSGAYVGNIAVLEATAERLSRTNSIESAIREAHDELKRSESRRSSLLQATIAKQGGPDVGSVPTLPPISTSRRSSIIRTNSVARSGGYSPAGYIMSAAPSLSTSTRLRSGSTTSSFGILSPMVDSMLSTAADLAADKGAGESQSFFSPHGSRRSSLHSVRSAISGKLSLTEIAEMEHPTTLTQEALDEADRLAAAGEDPEDDDTIRASAIQHVEAAFADLESSGSGPHGKPLRPAADQEHLGESTRRLQLHRADRYDPFHYQQAGSERPATSGSGETYEQAREVFGDFDGVHCDPDMAHFPELREAESKSAPQRAARPVRPVRPVRPTSYIDPVTGQQMLYYPAHVPAMLNLPPKLSKKSSEKAALNKRRSAVLGAMQQSSRASRVWLPDPLEGLGRTDASPLMETVGEEPEPVGPEPSDREPMSQLPDIGLGRLDGPSLEPLLPGAGLPPREIRIPPRLTGPDRRKSKATLGGLETLPPQLRASVFFDAPPAPSPKLEMKHGSATATLDSILDASIAAPVNAFTDHVFAGKLGSEVYGRTGKRRSKKPAAPAEENASKKQAVEETQIRPSGPKKLVKRNSVDMLRAGTPEPRKRASFLNLLGGKRSSDELDVDPRKSVLGGGTTPGGEEGPLSPDPLAPDEDEEPYGEEEDEDEEDEDEGENEDEDEDEAEDEDEGGYNGPPTTLLAELQLRKQQQKMRTRPVQQAYPNGLHSTLLELDAVHEVERKTRKGKRVNLAWEDGAMEAEQEEDDDEDVPLAMLFAAKTAASNGVNRSTLDISALMGEVNRPMGLMERREIEESEPLSRRRDRLQGKETGPMPVSLGMVKKQMSSMNLTPTLAALHARSQSRLTLPLEQQVGQSENSEEEDSHDENGEPEIPGESLAARKQRLAAENPLPRARPVSGIFSSELLSQFGGDTEGGRPDSSRADSNNNNNNNNNNSNSNRTSKAMDRAKENAPLGSSAVPEEEETLGQRRRRLQAEREAREREMGLSGPSGGSGGVSGRIRPVTANPAGDTAALRISRRLSLADVLMAHPIEGPQGAGDPRELERQRREAEAQRVQQERDAKMAALRAQMPSNLTTPSVGAHHGGYLGGRFNDGLGGGVSPSARQSLGYFGAGAAGAAGAATAPPRPHLLPQQRSMSMFAPGAGAGMGMSMPANGGYGAAVGGFGAYGVNTNAYGVSAQGAMGTAPGMYGAGAGMPMNAAYGMGVQSYGGGTMTMPGPAAQAGHLDMVERWRQGVTP